MKNKLIILLSCSLLLSDGVGTTAAEWLELQTGVRAIGMGGAQVAAGRGISSVLYNPANLGYTQNEEAYFNKTNYLAGISHNVLGYAKQLNDFDIVGLNIFFLDSGSMYETDVEGVVNEEGEGGLFKVYNFE